MPRSGRCEIFGLKASIGSGSAPKVSVSSRSENVVLGPWKRTTSVPVEPWRFFAVISSASPRVGVPVIALSQLSRSCEQRGGAKIPILSDLRESGAIEQDADIVAFVYRPEYYNIEQDEAGNPTRGIAEIITAKNRHGALKTAVCRFTGSRMRFSDLDTAGMLIDRFSEPLDAFNPNISHRPDLGTDLPF